MVAVFSGGDGWALLREGRAREAQAAFGGAAARQPRDGGVKAGFAIAAAASGELEMAAWSMRRALKVDAKALAHLPVDESLSRTLLTLIDEFAISEGGRVEMRDAAFMRAALHYLLGEPGAARRALALAVEMGEDNPGADALQRLIAETSSVG
ncbi:MAG: hypothetical protein R3174_15480 [Gammaproteobacteria bacterium]|nr:hypothetical protein [Gammaproteobacteria bacterium]